jgi:hypothetical protein
MQTATQHVHPPRRETRKNTTQTISLVVGFLLFVLGLCGILYPAFMGLHLSVLHSLVITAAGITLFYNGYKVNSHGAYYACLGFGIFFALHALAGFIFGQAGVPNVGFQRFDNLTLEIIPNYTVLGTTDHILNAILGVVLLIGAYDWRQHRLNRRSLL